MAEYKSDMCDNCIRKGISTVGLMVNGLRTHIS